MALLALTTKEGKNYKFWQESKKIYNRLREKYTQKTKQKGKKMSNIQQGIHLAIWINVWKLIKLIYELSSHVRFRVIISNIILNKEIKNSF